MNPKRFLSTNAIIKFVAAFAVAIVLLSAFFGSFVIVPSGFVGVVTTLGKVTGEIQPGFQWKVPFVQSVVQMNVQIQKEQAEAGAATHDLQSVSSTVALNYHLDHAQVSNVFVNLSADYVNRVISPTVQEAVKVVTARYDAADLLAKRAQVADDITKLLVDKLQPRGIIVDQVSIVHFEFSSAFNQSIEQKQVAQQDAQRAQYELQTAQLKAQANQVQQAALTPEILEQQAIAKWNGTLPLYVGQGSVFNIPLNK
jgi:regulator of protease activity HflC (stomatin/prohibitin superfamily)